MARPSTAWLEPLAVSLAPGALLGTQVAALLFFLNPELPFGPLPFLRAAALYGGLLGLASTVLLLPFLWGRRRRARRLLPWLLTASLVAATLLAWFHAARLSFYLPPGINLRLIKAAGWLSLVSVVAFYTCLLHSIHRRRYGWKSRWLLVLLCLSAVVASAERRVAFEAPPPPSPRASAVAPGQRPALWVIGLDGATLDGVLPLATQGRLPFFARLLKEGAYGRLESLPPRRQPALWTSLATGRLPYRHGLVAGRAYPARFHRGSELRILPRGIGFELWGTLGAPPRRLGAESVAALPLWEILGRLGVVTGLVGWPASAPVPPELRFSFSDRYFAGEFGPDTAAPPELAERGLLFRLSAEELDPRLGAGLGDEAPLSVLRAFAQDRWRYDLTRFVLEQMGDSEAHFLHLPGLEVVSREYFGAYSAVHLEGLPPRRFSPADQYVPGYYRLLDELLASLWERVSEPRLLALVSAYGVDPPSGWRRLWGEISRNRPMGGSTRGAPDGVLFLAGNGIRGGAQLKGVGLVDVAPTLLYGMGFPVARDLDGQVLTDAFENAFLASHPLTYLPSYETLAPAGFQALGGGR